MRYGSVQQRPTFVCALILHVLNVFGGVSLTPEVQKQRKFSGQNCLCRKTMSNKDCSQFTRNGVCSDICQRDSEQVCREDISSCIFLKGELVIFIVQPGQFTVFHTDEKLLILL